MKSFKLVLIVLTGVLFAISLTSVLTSCDNFFHDLVPPDGDRIISFKVPDQVGDAIIGDDSISFAVKQDANIYDLLPAVTVSPRASVLPLTFDYLRLAFPDVDIAKESIAISMTSDLPGYVWNLIENTPGFNVPDMTIPIDFSRTVDFLVISAKGTVRTYSVGIGNASQLGEPGLWGFSFSKFDNPEIIESAVCEINDRTRSLSVLVKYPIEMTGLSFELIPSFEIWGETLEVNGQEIESGTDTIQFNPFFGTQTKIISVTLGDKKTDYTLSIVFAEDPDSIRSITDFRFTKADNPEIAADAVSAIVNNDSVGTITVQVFYSGAKPVFLSPRFISPGNVSSGGSPVSNGVSLDFSSPLELRVVSKNGQYSRVYTVKTEYYSLTADTPRILTFNFPRAINPGLVADVTGEINDDAGTIRAVVRYGGSFAAETLTPEFTSEGLVSVSGSVQVSGSSARDFTRQVKYSVTNPLNEMLKRDYMVECQFIRDVSADAGITDFGFYPEDNVGLTEALPARIDHEAGRISLIAPIGSGVTTRTMVPRFTAAGQVTVGGTIQYTGFSGQLFDAPIIYTVVSTNGVNRREYTVDVRELGTTIFVNPNATGQNNGLSWADAYNNLNAACEAATMFQAEVPKEIWITGGIYTPGNSTDDFFQVAPNTSYIGGFAGNETSKSQRNVSANPVIISGDVAKRPTNNIHGAFFSRTVLLNGEDVTFEDLNFRYFMHNKKTAPSFIYIPVSIRYSSRAAGTVNVINCNFTDVNGPCVETYNGSAYMRNVNADRIAAMYHNSKSVNELHSHSVDIIETVKINNQIPYGDSGYDPLFVIYSGEFANSAVTVENVEIQNSKLGMQIFAGFSSVTVNGITATNINTEDKAGGGKGSVLDINGSRSISISNVDIDGVNNGRSFMGTVYIEEPRGNIFVDAITIKNVAVGYGDEFGGAGGFAVNWANSQPAFRGGIVEIKNMRLENIDWRRLPALCIFKPEADVYLDAVSVTANDLTASYSEDNMIMFGTTYCVHVYGFNNLDMNKAYIEGLNKAWTAYFYGAILANSDIEIKNSTAKNATLSVNAGNSNINVNNFRSLGNGTLSVGGSNSVITVDDIDAKFSCNASYKSLALTNASIEGYLYIYGSTNTQNTNLNRVTMRDPDPTENVNLTIGNSGELRVENSTLLSYYRKHSYTATNGSYAYTNVNDIYWGNVGGRRHSGIFNNVNFDFYILPRINYTYNDSYSAHINAASGYSYTTNANSQGVDLKFTNCTFNYNLNNDPYIVTFIMYYDWGSTYYLGRYQGTSTLDLDNVRFNNFSTASNYKILWMRNTTEVRIKSNSSIKGVLLDTQPARAAFNALTQKLNGDTAVNTDMITWY